MRRVLAPAMFILLLDRWHLIGFSYYWDYLLR